MTEQPILTNPDLLLHEYIGTLGTSDAPFNFWRLGELSLALRIETTRRIFESVAGNSLLAMSREEICSVLQQCLVNAGLWDDTQAWYQRLWEWNDARRLKFAADGESSAGVSPDEDRPANLSRVLPPEESQLSLRIADPDGESSSGNDAES